MWMRQKKDTLALGNITGAMVFQSTFPVAIGMASPSGSSRRTATGTRRWPPAWPCSRALLYGRLRFTKRGFGVGSLLFGGVLYAAFLGVTLWSIL